MKRYSKRYDKNLHHLTTIRIPTTMRDDCERKATFLGISFSDFVRQSINRNLFISAQIEDEVLKQTAEQTIGRSL